MEKEKKTAGSKRSETRDGGVRINQLWILSNLSPITKN